MKNRLKYITSAGLAFILFSSAASANCLPPMQTLFACTFENIDTRVEFCHEIATERTSNASSVPGDQSSYSLARGTAPTELYFTPTTSYFNVISASAIDQKIYGRDLTDFLVIGYENVDYVYAALIGVDDRYYDSFYGAEVRVYKNENDFQNMADATPTGNLQKPRWRQELKRGGKNSTSCQSNRIKNTVECLARCLR